MSNVLKPTVYGPVAQGGSESTDIDAQTRGSLNCLVQQPNDTSPSFDINGVGQYREQWKGPYSVIKDLAQKMVNLKRSDALEQTSLQKISRFSPPDPGVYKDGTTMAGARREWTVTGVEVHELEAGDHATLTVIYSNDISTSGTVSPWTDVKDDNIWTLEWQPYTVNPYAFCVNDMTPDRSPKEQAVPSDTASRYNIEQFLNQKKVDLSGWTYINDQNKTKVLNQAEQLICKKIISNVNCQWHYPVITHNTSKYTTLSNGLSVVTPPVFPSEVGGVDFTYEDDAPCLSGMPFEFLDTDYQWVKIDDSVSGYKDGSKFTYKRQEKFMGVISADQNYYGIVPFNHNSLSSCRWEIGRL